MLMFVPTSYSGYNAYQRRPHFAQPVISPRDKYLTAVADARLAEAEYAAALANEEAGRRRLERARLSNQQDEDIRQLLFSPVLHPNSSYKEDSYVCSDSDSFPTFDHGQHFARERGLATLRDRQEHEEQAQRLAYLRLQQEQRERIRRAREEQQIRGQVRLDAFLQRQKEVGLKGKDEARKAKEEIRGLLRVLFDKPVGEAGGRSDVGQQTELKSVSTPKPAVATKAESCVCRGHTCKSADAKGVSESPESAAPQLASRSPALSLKAELEKRLGNEYETEVRDTIEAVLASLFHRQPTGTTAAQSSSSPVSDGSTKGKGKAVSFDVPATYNDVVKSLTQIKNLEAGFLALESDFVFPRNLDFTPPASPTPSDTESGIKLAYTSLNSPIHNYTHALSHLLSQLDAVESFGSDDVRHRRKDVIDRVEGALEGVEKVVEEKARLGRRSSGDALDAKDVTKERRKASAREFVEGEAFIGSSGAVEDVALSFAVSGVAAGDAIISSKETGSTPTVEGYSVTDDEAILEPDSLDTDVVVGQPVVEEEEGVAVIFDAPENEEAPTSEFAISYSFGEEELSSVPNDSKDIPSSRSVLGSRETERALSYPPATLKSPNDSEQASEQVETFLLTDSSSAEFPPRRPNVTQEDNVVADDGSDWSEVEA